VKRAFRNHHLRRENGSVRHNIARTPRICPLSKAIRGASAPLSPALCTTKCRCYVEQRGKHPDFASYETPSVKSIRLAMMRNAMRHVPSFVCPADYTIRTYRRGDETHWAEIESSAGEFPDAAQALHRFTMEFGPFLDALESRCFILEDSSGTAIGTATAWHGLFAGEERGRVHWVGLVPMHQGKGLSRPLLSAVLTRLAQDYRTAYLTTRTTNYRAINLYCSFGFEPYLVHGPDEGEGWAMVEQLLQRKLL